MAKGREDNSQNRFENTIVPKSAEQAMLVKQDEIIDKLNAILAAVEGEASYADMKSALQTALGADLSVEPAQTEKVALD